MEFYTNIDSLSWAPHPVAEGVEIKPRARAPVVRLLRKAKPGSAGSSPSRTR